jgi:hypothetical protein
VQAIDAAGDAAQAITPIKYVGPIFAVIAVAMQYWSAYVAVPEEARKMLQSCQALLADVIQAWPSLQQDSMMQPRLERWIEGISDVAQTYIELKDRRAGRCTGGVRG